MNPVLITATAAGLGSMIGAAASITTTWITQRTQSIRAIAEWRQREREALFKEFIAEASRLAIDALTWFVPSESASAVPSRVTIAPALI